LPQNGPQRPSTNTGKTSWYAKLSQPVDFL
jgi:hypothetical protein